MTSHLSITWQSAGHLIPVVMRVQMLRVYCHATLSKHVLFSVYISLGTKVICISHTRTSMVSCYYTRPRRAEVLYPAAAFDVKVQM